MVFPTNFEHIFFLASLGVTFLTPQLLSVIIQ